MRRCLYALSPLEKSRYNYLSPTEFSVLAFAATTHGRGSLRCGQIAALSTHALFVNRREWLRTAIIVGFLMLAILFAQSRRNCEIPGSTWIRCAWGKPLRYLRI